ncbi:MAG: hypothetical protein HY581_02405 [Nitrospirae bacterium]|nr:hypothetical protein [Nitrospirota bacterium]
MRRLLSLEALFFTVFVLGRISWAGEVWDQPDGLKRFPVTQLDLGSADDSPHDLAPLMKRFHNVVSLKTSYLATPLNPLRLKDVLLEKEEHRNLSFLGTTSLFEGKLVGEGEMTYSPSDPKTAQRTGDARHRLLRLGFTGTQGTLRYGVTYRSAGKAFTSLPDQAIRELWGEWQVGVTRLRSSLTEVWNNLDKDPSRPRMTQTQEKISLSLAPTPWPEISLSYTRGSASSSLEPTGVVPQRSQVDTLEGALSYTRTTWTARLASTYSLISDRLHPGVETEGWDHSFSGSYRPMNILTIAPTLSVREDRQRWSGVSTKTPSVALSLTYSPDKMFNFTAFGSYSKTHSTDGFIDSLASNAKSVVSWTFQGTSPLRTTLSFEAVYRNSLDAIRPARSTEDLSGLVRVQLAGF